MGSKKRPSEGDELAQKEEGRALLLLNAWVSESGDSIRAIEARCGWSQSTLNRILSGATSLRVSYLAAICRAIDRPLEEFYAVLAGLEPRQAGDALMSGASLGFAGELGKFADAAVAAGYNQGVIRELLALIIRLKS